MKPGRRKESQGEIEPAQRRESTVEQGNVIKDVQYCSRRLEQDPLLFEIVVDNVSGQEQPAPNSLHESGDLSSTA